MTRSVCMVTPSATGGHAQFTWELMNALAATVTDHRLTLLTSKGLENRFRSTHYKVEEVLPRHRHRREFSSVLTWALSRYVAYSRRERLIERWLTANRPDIVHFQEFAPWLGPKLFSNLRTTGMRIFAHVHNVRPHRYPPLIRRTKIDMCNRRAWRQCETLFVLGERTRAELSQFLGPDHPPICVAPHGVWTVDRPPPPSEDERIRRRRLLFFGTIRPNKGLHLLLDALLQIERVALTIAGEVIDASYWSGEVLPRVRKIREAGGDIEILDQYVNEADSIRLFDEASFLVLPYTSFCSQSGVLFLAAAHGIPVVATDVGSIGEAVRQHSLGWLVERPDAISIARTIKSAFAAQPVSISTAEMSWSSSATVLAKAYREGA